MDMQCKGGYPMLTPYDEALGRDKHEVKDVKESCKDCTPCNPVIIGPNAMDTQVGGSHYKHFKFQPTEFIMANELSFLQGCIIKRICRYKIKGGLEDLRKIQHEVDMIIELEWLE